MIPSLRLLIVGHVVTLLAASAAGSDAIQRMPFTAADASAGDMRFTRLGPAVTRLAVDNPYEDPQMWGKRYREFMGGGMGSGVAAGDFDGDGRVDLYVSTKTRPGRLFRNLGGWRFEDVTEAAGLSEEPGFFDWLRNSLSDEKPVIWRQGAVFVDVDNDGWLDLYICRNNAPNLLYMNRGGRFTEEAEKRGLAVVDGSVIGAFADYDRDGWLDVLILTNQVDGTEPSGRRDRLFRNTGNGRFVEVTDAAGIVSHTFGHAAVWFDYNGDRFPDLYIANDFAGPDYFYRNNGDGTFTNVIDEIVPHTPYSSMGADTADVDNDGHIDLLVADMASTTREKDRRGLAASRNDVLAASTQQTAPQYMRNALYLNTGLGVFREAACWAGVDATDWTWSVRFEDFDNDGWTDLHVTNGMVREANNSDLLERMMRALSDMERIKVMKNSPPLEESNLAYRNVGGGVFEPVTAAWGLEEVSVSFGAATADFDQDGDLDLVYLNYNGGLSVYRNDVVGQHRVQVRLRGTQSNRFGIGAIVRVESGAAGLQSRTMTVARGYAAGSEIVAHFGLGNDTSIRRLVVEWPSGITQEFEDLPADQAYLITESRAASSPAATEPQPLFRASGKECGMAVDDRSSFAIPDHEQAFLPFRTDRRGPGVAVADLDGDGRDDLYLGSTTGSPARLLRWQDGRYQQDAPRGIPAGDVEEGPPLFFDADGNGTPDLLVTRASAKAAAWPDGFRPVIYSNDGKGGFSATEWLPELALNVGAACAADFDGDGDLDLFLGGRSIPGGYPETPHSVLLRNDGGRFVVVSEATPVLGGIGLVKSALFRDVDQDGRPDLILALEWDHVRYLRNDGNGRFSDFTERAGFTSGGRGWWNSLAAADFNGDGRLDFAAGNVGLNTTYEASPTRPATLLHGDFARNGIPLLAEAVYEDDVLYPLRPRVDLATRLPFVLRKYPKNDDFARATLDQVLGETAVASATVHKADNFFSGVFLSQPDGTYRFAPLPREAQIGPIHGVVALDLDGDRRIDLCAVNNSDAAIPRFDGGTGTFLQGRGDGTFVPLPPTVSGVLIPGNARALVSVDADDDARPDLFLTRHGDASELLANRAAGAARWLTLRLRGPAGNADAVGARVMLTHSDGTTSYHEVGLGGGWLSQSAARIFVAVSDDARVTSAEVRWPDGRVTRHHEVPSGGRWLIAPTDGS